MSMRYLKIHMVSWMKSILGFPFIHAFALSVPLLCHIHISFAFYSYKICWFFPLRWKKGYQLKFSVCSWVCYFFFWLLYYFHVFFKGNDNPANHSRAASHLNPENRTGFFFFFYFNFQCAKAFLWNLNKLRNISQTWVKYALLYSVVH